LKIQAHASEFFGSFAAFGFGRGARPLRFGVLKAGFFSASTSGLCFGVQLGDFLFCPSELRFDAPEVAAELIVLESGRNERLLGFHVLCDCGSDLLIAGGNFLCETRCVRLLFGGNQFEAHGLGLVLSKFALQGKRSCFSLASTGNHSTVIARAVRCEEILVHIFPRHTFSDRGRFHEICCAEFTEEVFRSGAEGIAEINETIEACQNSFGERQGISRLGNIEIQFIQ
jgi:hypothetical protein